MFSKKVFSNTSVLIRASLNRHAIGSNKFSGFSQLGNKENNFLPNALTFNSNILTTATEPNQHLFAYIKKNIFIPKFLNCLRQDNKQVQALRQAILLGDFQHPIFSDEDCYLYLLYIMQHQLIPHPQCLTAYFYLLAKIQFTNTQPIKKEDLDVKVIWPLQVERLIAHDKLTQVGEEYIVGAHTRFKEIGYRIPIDDMLAFVKELPPIEQWLLKIPHGCEEDAIDNLAYVLLINMPMLVPNNLRLLERATSYLQPSVSLFNYFLTKIGNKPVMGAPMLGTIGKQTLEKLHAHNMHPLSLYGLHVRSNLKTADNYRCGPYYIGLHDCGHIFWGSLLTQNERNKLYTCIIPSMHALKNKAAMVEDMTVVQRLDEIIDRLNSFDLTDIRFNRGPWYMNYLHESLRPRERAESKNFNSLSLFGNLNAKTRFADCTEDRVYFLLNYQYYKLLARDQKAANIWEEMLTAIKQVTDEKIRPQRYLRAIETVAQSAANKKTTMPLAMQFFANKVPRLNIDELQATLNKTNVGTLLWERLITENCEDLLMLLTECRAPIFEPYLPFSSTMQNSLRSFLRAGANSSGEHEPDENTAVPRMYSIR